MAPNQSLSLGTRVRVKGVHGLTLEVEPVKTLPAVS
jgi:membrane protein implicated in regulation of membrane protease activity